MRSSQILRYYIESLNRKSVCKGLSVIERSSKDVGIVAVKVSTSLNPPFVKFLSLPMQLLSFYIGYALLVPIVHLVSSTDKCISKLGLLIGHLGYGAFGLTAPSLSCQARIKRNMHEERWSAA